MRKTLSDHTREELPFLVRELHRRCAQAIVEEEQDSIRNPTLRQIYRLIFKPMHRGQLIVTQEILYRHNEFRETSTRYI